MMNRQIRPQQQAFDEAWFEQVFLALDRLHDAVSAEPPRDYSPVNPVEMVGWLEDIIYTAQETIREIQANCLVESVTGAGYSGAESEDHDDGFGLN
jgi:hypothetical protein